MVRIWNRHAGKIVPLLLVMMAVCLMGLIVVAARVSHNATTAIRVRVAAEMRQCERLQQQRREDNNTAFRQKEVVELLTHTLLNPGILAVLPPKDRDARVADATRLAAEGKTILYQPPTNCERAVNDLSYKRPEPVPFPAQFKPSG